jgi:two-component system response regulator FixJ
MPPPPIRRPPCILLVEDDPSLLGALVFALEADGLSVRPYATAGALLEAPGEADCLVIDLVLPDLDGLSLIGKLREMRLDAPAILITTNPTARNRARAYAAGVQIVEKPLIGGELRRRIGEAIGEALA